MKRLLAGLRDLYVDCFSGVSLFRLGHDMVEIGISTNKTKILFVDDMAIVFTESYCDGELFDVSPMAQYLLSDTAQILQRILVQLGMDQYYPNGFPL